MPSCFPHGFQIKNANASAFGPVSKRTKVKIPGLRSAKHGHSAVPFDQIVEIRRQHEQEGKTFSELARRFGYNVELVRNWCQYVQRVFA